LLAQEQANFPWGSRAQGTSWILSVSSDQNMGEPSQGLSLRGGH
jgi:hypothetical protein